MSATRLTGLTLACLAALFTACLLGSTPIGIDRVVAALLGGGSPGDQLVVVQIRLPRAMTAFAVGAALGASGAALQGLLRNPLAEPGVLGVSAVASLGATGALYYGYAAISAWAMPAAAIVGALAGTALIALAALRTASTVTLILIGVGLSSFAGAAMNLMMNLAPNPFSLVDMVNWMLGTVANRSFQDLGLRCALPGSGSRRIVCRQARPIGVDAGRGSGQRRWLEPAAAAAADRAGRGYFHRRGGISRRRNRLRRHRRAAYRPAHGGS